MLGCHVRFHNMTALKKFLLLCVSTVRNKRQNERKLETGTITKSEADKEKE